MEISEDRVHGKRYLDMSVEMESEDESPDSKEKRIYRKNVAWSHSVRNKRRGNRIELFPVNNQSI